MFDTDQTFETDILFIIKLASKGLEFEGALSN
jgi:hypothetical protein